jgi:hypothetical protein
MVLGGAQVEIWLTKPPFFCLQFQQGMGNNYQVKMENVIEFFYFINTSPNKGFSYIFAKKCWLSKKKANGLYKLYIWLILLITKIHCYSLWSMDLLQYNLLIM